MPLHQDIPLVGRPELFSEGPPSSLKEAQATIQRTIEAYEFEYFTYLGGQVSSFVLRGMDKFVSYPTVLTTLPAEWISVYHANNYGTVDPVITEIVEGHITSNWDLETLRTEKGNPVGDFIRDAHDFGVCRGYTVPIYGPKGDYGVVSLFGSSNPVEFNRHVLSMEADVFMLAHRMHQAMRDFVRPASDEITLTPREKEVLQWIAAGKTGEEIGIILSVSDKTVQYHTYNAMRKLDVFSRAQAVSKTIACGLIYPLR